jgi:hypothetical protein
VHARLSLRRLPTRLLLDGEAGRDETGTAPPVSPPTATLAYPAARPGAPCYAEAFSPLPGRCFRLVAHHGAAGPTHCPQPATWRGSWRAPNGHRYRIEARQSTGPHGRPAPGKPVSPGL